MMPAEGRGSASCLGGAIRVFIVDDSALIRAVFTRLVEAEPGLEVAGCAATAEDALTQLAGLQVHVILLDLEMPGMGGMRALPEIIRRSGGARVMVVSTLTAEGAEHTVQALALGAADALRKPGPGGYDQAYRDRLVERIRGLGRRPLRRSALAGEARPLAIRPPKVAAPPEVLAIGASTGGIHATSQFLAALPPLLGLPILITQHLPAEFSHPYASQLREIAGREVVVAEEGMELVPDRVHLAPGDAHAVLARAGSRVVIRLDRTPAPTGCLPSVDPMLASLARVFGAGALAVVLTGMGRDGTEGARVLVESGGTVFVQDEASSAVWGMPGSIARAGYATAILHPRELALRVAACARQR